LGIAPRSWRGILWLREETHRSLCEPPAKEREKMRTITLPAAACAALFVSPSTIGAIQSLDGVAQAWDFAKGVSYYEADSTFSPVFELYAGVDTNGGFDDTFVQTTVSTAGDNVLVSVDTQCAGNGAVSLKIDFELTGAPDTLWLIGEAGDFTEIMDFVPDLDAPNPGEIVSNGTAATVGSYLLLVDNPDWETIFDPNGIMDSTWLHGTGLYTFSLTVPTPSVLAILPLVGLGLGGRRRRA
jgi:hypothetical protein